jgi:putative phosphoesterase
MRVAALCDIHGNLPALEAVIRDIRRLGVERVVVGGDVLPGPMPRETMACLTELDLPTEFIQGNGDREVLARMRGQEMSALPKQAQEAIEWVAQELGAEHERVLASWRMTLRREIGGLGEVLFCHATPRSDTENFTRLTPEEPLVPIFQTGGAEVAVCGHTHMQFDRRIGKVRVLNAGSVGMPFGEPGAYWLLLGPNEAELRFTSYDLARAAERIRNTRYPQAEEFAERNILHPPSEEKMLELFGKAGR